MCVRYTEGIPGYLNGDLRSPHLRKAHEGDIVVSVSTLDVREQQNTAIFRRPWASS